MRALIPVLLVGLAAAPAFAEDDADWRFGGDAYMAGRAVTLSGDGVDNLFAAGDRVTARADIAGSAHMAGRNVTLEARVGENFYGAGQTVKIEGAVAGDVTIAGENLVVAEPVSGNLRAMGATIDLIAPVAGSAIVAGETVLFDAAITGDVMLAVASVDWGENAVVAGELHVYADDPDDIPVPERVASADQVTYHETKQFEGVMDDLPGMERPSLVERLRNWIGGVIVVGVLGTLFAAIAPNFLANMRARAIARPVFTGVVGFVGLSALFGSVILLAMTGLGILLIPLSISAAVLLAITGYVIGAYALGVWATGVAGRAVPATTGDRAIAAFAGAVVAAVIGLIPWIGWLAVMAIFLVGAGALVARTIRLDREDLAA